jgi:hypothetical protein
VTINSAQLPTKPAVLFTGQQLVALVGRDRFGDAYRQIA